jgi:hypothetical protein
VVDGGLKAPVLVAGVAQAPEAASTASLVGGKLGVLSVGPARETTLRINI